MKKILLFLVILTVFQLQAQSQAKSSFSHNLINSLDRLSIHVNMSTPSFSFSELSKINAKKLGQVSLGEINIAYKLSPRWSVGLSSMSQLVSNQAGYFNEEGQFFSFCSEDEDEDDDMDEDGDEDDDMEDDDCDDLDALLGSLTFRLSEQLPFFIQAASGYSFAGRSLAYSTMIGYHQKVVGNVGIMAGIRYSDVLYKKPIEAVSTTATSGVRIDLGLSWNF